VAGPAEPWRVEEPPPDEVVPLLGVWFMEGDQFVIRWRDGALEARFPDDPDWKDPAVLRRESDDRWRVASGWEHGEALRVERDGDGAVVRLVLAGYPSRASPPSGLIYSYGALRARSAAPRAAREDRGENAREDRGDDEYHERDPWNRERGVRDRPCRSSARARRRAVSRARRRSAP